MTPAGSQWLNVTQAAYKVDVRLISVALGTGYVQFVAADPMRWYIEFRGLGAANTAPLILPGVVPDGMPTGTNMPVPGPYKYADCPSVVTGPFFIDNTLAPQVVVIAVRYVGP